MNNHSFNFENQIGETEGFFPRIFRVIRKLSRKITIALIIALVGLLLTAVGLHKQMRTTDAGLVIMQLYNEAKANSSEIRKMVTLDVLPKEMECYPEVLKIRMFQNDIIQFYTLVNVGLEEKMNLFTLGDSLSKKKIISNQDIDEFVSLYSIICDFDLLMAKMELEVNESFYNNIWDVAIQDSDTASLYSSSLTTINDDTKIKKEYLNLSQEFNDELMKSLSEVKNMDVKSRRKKVLSCLFSLNKHNNDSRMRQLFDMRRKKSIMYIRVSSQRLQFLYKKWLENEINNSKQSN